MGAAFFNQAALFYNQTNGLSFTFISPVNGAS